MASTGSSIGSLTDSTRRTRSDLIGTLHIPGYHFKNTSSPWLTQNDSVSHVCGYRLSDKTASVAKVSTLSLQLEREYYTIKQLYSTSGGSSYLVRPLEYINLPSGLAVAIYADEGCDLFTTDVSNDVGTFLHFAIQCTDILEFIHRQNTVHSQISLKAFQWRGGDTRVKLWNFGSGSSFERLMTSEGWRKTTANCSKAGLLSMLMYMSPEQTGRTTYRADHRSDIYSMGIVFFILLTDRNPYEGGPLEVLNGILNKRIPPIHELQMTVPEIVSRIIEKMTSKAPDDRYSSMQGVRCDFKECLKRLSLTESESIPPFPLGQSDIASVFMLPRAIFGRQSLLSEMVDVVERFTDGYKPARLQSSNYTDTYTSNTKSYKTISTDQKGSQEQLDDLGQSATSISFASTIEDSNMSSSSSKVKSSNDRQATTIAGIYGPGGVGKTTLLTAVQPLARKNGYVATSKFDSRNRTPYAGLLDLLSQVFQQILSESEDEIERFYEHLKLSLGEQFSNLHLLTDQVPELKPLVLTVSPEEEQVVTRQEKVEILLDNAETCQRFHNVFVEVLRTMSNWQMITIFLDDLHQADDPSIELLQSLAISRVKILLFISYRDQEISGKQATLLESDLADIHFIQVDALDMNALFDYVCDMLHRSGDTSRDYVMPLVEMVYKQTKGNAFYMVQLLRTLERKKLIYFNWEKNEWEYDMVKIEKVAFLDMQSELDTAFTVARLRELSRDGQVFLKWASFVGDTFSWSTVKALMMGSDIEDGDDWSTEGSVMSDYTDTTPRTHDVSDNSDRRTSWTLSATEENLHPISSRKSGTSRTYDPIRGLHAVLREGYVLPIGSDEFKWSHDRITQAAGELTNPEAHSRIHFKIAQYLMHEDNVDTFLAANHLLKCPDVLLAIDNKEPYQKLMTKAGHKGRQSGAHTMAFSYYRMAIMLNNPVNEWNDENYERTLSLYTNALVLSWVAADYDKTLFFLETVFTRGKTPLDRKVAYQIQSRYFLSHQMQDKGRDSLLTCLIDLGDNTVYTGTKEELDKEYRRLKDNIERIGMDKIVDTGPCCDSLVRAHVEVIEELLFIYFWTDQKHDMYLLAFYILNLALEKGITPVVGSVCSFLGVGLIEEYRDYSYAEEIGRLGISIAEKYGSAYEKGRAYHTYGSFISQWKSHTREAIPILHTAYQFSSSAGDRIYAHYSQIHASCFMFSIGTYLGDVLPIAERCFQDINHWSIASDTNVLAMGLVRMIKALQGRTYWETCKVFDGDDGFNDANFVTESFKSASNHDIPMCWYNSWKIIPLVLYGELQEASVIGLRIFNTLDSHPCTRHVRVSLMYYSLALVEIARRDPSKYNECINQVRRNQDTLYEWVKHSPMNFAMCWTLVEAELASLGGWKDMMRSLSLYEKASNEAREGGYYLELGIIHEYAGAFYLNNGVKNVAYIMVKKSIALYTNHGSYGKTLHLNKKYADLLSDFSDNRGEAREMAAQTDPFPFLSPHHPHPWSHSSLANSVIANEPYLSESIPPVTTEQTLMTLDIIDMASILKSSQVLASEVKFEALLKSMMSIILENSGADCGAIIVKEEKYGIGAYGTQEAGSTTYDRIVSLTEEGDLVSSLIIHHTIHTNESVFIPDVSQDPRFAVGPWFDRAGEKSVICMPIIHKTTTVGCLFIEGAVGIFTQRHITVLALLCQQMGISLTNASLFKSIQRVTMANMRMIEMQKQALEAEKRSKEAADKATRLREIFLANMSHEIRTPFSGFYGMISLLAETKLDPEQYDLVKTAKGSCEMLLQIIDDLLNFSKLQAGKVSLDLAPIHLEELIADVIEMLIAMAIQKRINITYTLADDVPPVIMADANRLRQIIINLLGNAIKFTHQGEITIKCSVDPQITTTNDEISLLFEVIDTGIGISEEQRKVLFIPFSQVDGSTTRKYGGTGLGLSISLQLVQLMSGQIGVISSPGFGSNFRFSVHVVPVKDQSEQYHQTMKVLLDNLKNIRILVVDTHQSTIDMVRSLLPGISLDGTCEASTIPLSVSYGLVMAGMFLSSSSSSSSSRDLSVWENQLLGVMEKAKCALLMHYPSSHFRDGDDSRVLFGSSSYQELDRKHCVVRLAVPLRREKLLRTIVELLQTRSTTSPTADMRMSLSQPKLTARRSGGKMKTALAEIPEAQREAFTKMNILVAEDNPVAQKLLYKQLKRYSFIIVCANNGEEAIEAWKKQVPGFFKMGFFDHHMPKCDGVEATKMIRKMEAKVGAGATKLPIVALTADIQETARELCMTAGMDGYLTKPLNELSLLEMIKRYCVDV